MMQHKNQHTDVSGTGQCLADAGHDGDKHVLFLVKRFWIQTVANSKENETNIREEFLCCLLNRIGQKLDDWSTDEDGWLVHTEELVDKGHRNYKAQTNHSGTNCTTGKLRIIIRINNSTYF